MVCLGLPSGWYEVTGSSLTEFRVEVYYSTCDEKFAIKYEWVIQWKSLITLPELCLEPFMVLRWQALTWQTGHLELNWSLYGEAL